MHLILSPLSGRNPHYLIGEQVLAAPIVKDLGIETIPTGYLLIDGGSLLALNILAKKLTTPGQIISRSCFSGTVFRMKMIYLECGVAHKEEYQMKH